MSDAFVRSMSAPPNLFIIRKKIYQKIKATYRESFDKNFKLGSVILAFGLESSHSGIACGSKKARIFSSIFPSMDRDREEALQLVDPSSYCEDIVYMANIFSVGFFIDKQTT